MEPFYMSEIRPKEQIATVLLKGETSVVGWGMIPSKDLHVLQLDPMSITLLGKNVFGDLKLRRLSWIIWVGLHIITRVLVKQERERLDTEKVKGRPHEEEKEPGVPWPQANSARRDQGTGYFLESLLTSHFGPLTLACQNSEGIHLWCFKPPSLW